MATAWLLWASTLLVLLAGGPVLRLVALHRRCVARGRLVLIVSLRQLNLPQPFNWSTSARRFSKKIKADVSVLISLTLVTGETGEWRVPNRFNLLTVQQTFEFRSQNTGKSLRLQVINSKKSRYCPHLSGVHIAKVSENGS